MSLALRWSCIAVVALGSAVAAAPVDDGIDLALTLERVGARVQQYFLRAQSLVCLEIVRLRPFGTSTNEAPDGRTIESELRLSWEPRESEPAMEAKTHRVVLKVNGHAPREKDPHNCTTAEQQATETPPLAMLLPDQQREYVFTSAGYGTVDKRRAITVDYREIRRPSATSYVEDDNEDCLSFLIDGGHRGRIWIDPISYDVLRLDRGLSGLVEIPLPRKIANRPGEQRYWTMERMDTSIRFRPVTFQNPDETIVLPVAISSFHVTRGSGSVRRWTLTDYTQYKRFLTGARIVPN